MVQEETRPEKFADASPNPAVVDGNASAPKSTLANPATLWLRRTDQLLLGVLLVALLVLLSAMRWKLSGWGRTEIEIVSQKPREYFYSIEINQASWVEWAQLDGIGEKLARRIVSEREENGPFRSVNDIARVRGLGPKLIEKMRPFLICNTDVTSSAESDRKPKE